MIHPGGGCESRIERLGSSRYCQQVCNSTLIAGVGQRPQPLPPTAELSSGTFLSSRKHSQRLREPSCSRKSADKRPLARGTHKHEKQDRIGGPARLELPVGVMSAFSLQRLRNAIPASRLKGACARVQ